MSYYRSSQAKSNPDPIRVLIADESPLFRQAIKQTLSQNSNIEVVGEVADGYETMHLVQTLQPTLLILDVNLSGFSGLEVMHCVKEMKYTVSNLRPPDVLVVSTHCDSFHVNSMMKAGAAGYLSKREDGQEILNGVLRVAQGLRTMSDEALNQWHPHSSPEIQFTPRELEVLKFMALGEENHSIAKKLVIGIGTVKNYVSRIYNKLQIKTRAQAVAWAWQNRIVVRA